MPGLAVTSATVVIYGAAVRDPVQLLSQMKQPVAICLSLFGESNPAELSEGHNQWGLPRGACGWAMRYIAVTDHSGHRTQQRGCAWAAGALRHAFVACAKNRRPPRARSPRLQVSCSHKQILGSIDSRNQEG